MSEKLCLHHGRSQIFESHRALGSGERRGCGRVEVRGGERGGREWGRRGREGGVNGC